MLDKITYIPKKIIQSSAGQFASRNIAIIIPIAVIVLGLAAYGVCRCLKNRNIKSKTNENTNIPKLGDVFAKENFKLSEIKIELNTHTDSIAQHFTNISENIDRKDLEILAQDPKSENYAVAAAIYLALESDHTKRVNFVKAAKNGADSFLHLLNGIEKKAFPSDTTKQRAREDLLITLLLDALKAQNNNLRGIYSVELQLDNSHIVEIYDRIEEANKDSFICYISTYTKAEKVLELVNADNDALQRIMDLHFAGKLWGWIHILQEAEKPLKDKALKILEHKASDYDNLVAISKFSDIYSFDYSYIETAWNDKKALRFVHFALAIPKCSNDEIKKLYGSITTKGRSMILACLEHRNQKLDVYTSRDFKFTEMDQTFKDLTISELQAHINQIKANIDKDNLHTYIKQLYAAENNEGTKLEYDEKQTIVPYVLAMIIEENPIEKQRLVADPEIHLRYRLKALDEYCSAINLQSNEEAYKWLAGFAKANIKKRISFVRVFIKILDKHNRLERFYREQNEADQAKIVEATPDELKNKGTG